MTFDQACKYRMPDGKHCGKALDDIARDDDGLLYLDWMRGQDWCRGERKEAIDTYLNHSSIASDLEQLIGE